MSKKTKKLVPKLRFPAFQESEGWEYQELDPYLQGYSKRVPSNTQVPIYSSTRTGLRPQKEYFDDRELINDGEYGLVPDEYFVYRHMSDDGTFKFNINKTGGEIAVSKEYPVFTTLNLHSEFLLNLLNEGDGFKEFALAQKKGGTRTRLYLKVLRTWKAFLPSYSEQQKIADCLSSIDDLINAQSQKVKNLKTHRKGLMQQLFPREGETVPRLRFPEFRDAGEWNSEAFEDIYDFKVTNSFSRDMLNYENGSVKNIHYGDIHTKFSTLFDIENEKVPFINSSVSIDKIKQDCYCVEGDMVFADASEDLADVGKSIELVNLNGERLVTGLHTILARQKKKKLMLGFGGHLFKSQRIRKQIQKESQGAKVLGLSSGRLAKIKVAYPSDNKEQQKIADCLSSIDDLISTQTQKIETLKTHKKGLMQQLFPKMEADSE